MLNVSFGDGSLILQSWILSHVVDIRMSDCPRETSHAAISRCTRSRADKWEAGFISNKKASWHKVFLLDIMILKFYFACKHGHWFVTSFIIIFWLCAHGSIVRRLGHMCWGQLSLKLKQNWEMSRSTLLFCLFRSLPNVSFLLLFQMNLWRLIPITYWFR